MASAAQDQYVHTTTTIGTPTNTGGHDLPSTGYDITFVLLLAAILTMVGIWLRGVSR